MLKTKTQSTAYNLVTDKDMTYSYAETKTGSTWVDGKPIYRRVFKVTNKALSNGTVVQSFAKSGFSEITRIYAYLCGSDGGHIPFTRVGSSGKGSGIEYSSANNGFIFMGNDTWSAQSSRWLMIIAEYTK
nr:MAG TPA: hypothetical protein [Caudoviricetes sp.]